MMQVELEHSAASLEFMVPFGQLNLLSIAAMKTNVGDDAKDKESNADFLAVLEASVFEGSCLSSIKQGLVSRACMGGKEETPCRAILVDGLIILNILNQTPRLGV